MTEPFIYGLAPRIDAAFLSTAEIYEAVAHNTGNLAFVHAIHAHLGGNVRSVMWADPIELANQADTVAILPLAIQRGQHLDLAKQAERFQQITVPLVAIGLGAQSNLKREIPHVQESTLSWLRSLVDHAPSSWPNIGAQDASTMDVLDHLGFADHATIIGCPSHFINPTPLLGKQIAGRLHTPERIAVTAGDHNRGHLRRIEASLARLVTETDGSYIGQSPLDMMMLTRGQAQAMEGANLQECRDYIQPDMPMREFVDWSIRYGNLFSDAQRWLEHYRHFDFVIGTRVHGVILGIQSGIPSMCIIHDSGTLELCETLKIPYILAADVMDGVKRRDLVPRFNFDAEDFDRNRRAICRRYVQFLWSNGLAPAAWLDDIADYWQEEACMPAQPPP